MQLKDGPFVLDSWRRIYLYFIIGLGMQAKQWEKEKQNK
jgi:hypothetical protein